MSDINSSDEETYRKMFIAVSRQNEELKKQIALEVQEKYAAYRRIAELMGSPERQETYLDHMRRSYRESEVPEDN